MLLSLKSITLDPPLNQTGECLILTELILPRNGIARKASLKEIQVTKGKRSAVRMPFYEKGIFKEKVDGLFGIKVSVTRPLKQPEINQFIRQLFATGMEGLGEAASLSAYAKGLRDLIEVPFDEASDALASTSPRFIAVGGIDLDSERLVSGKISIPLKLTETIRTSRELPRSQLRDKRRTGSKSFNAGATIGELALDAFAD